jgi:hypothetical protein
MPRYIFILFREFVEICTFQKRPQDLPASGELCLLVVSVYLASGWILMLSAESVSKSLIMSIIDVVMLLLITLLFLYLRSVPGRWLQTSTALAGTGIIFYLLLSVPFYLRVYFPGNVSLQAFMELLILFLYLWLIAVMSYILKNALSSSYLLAIPGAIAYFVITGIVIKFLFPEVDTQ